MLTVDGTSRAQAQGDPTPRWSPREQQALTELGSTRYARGVRTTLITTFLAIVIGVPLFENVSEIRANSRTRARIIASGQDLSQFPGRRPRVFKIGQLLPSWRAVWQARTRAAWLRLLPHPDRLREFEDDLQLNSAAGKVIRPWVQWTLTGWLGTGSQKVLLGHDGWLFYSDGVQYVTGPGFMERAQLERRAAAGDAVDPRAAILQFHDELEALGVRLILVPVPDKAVIRPESLTSKAGLLGPAHNTSWAGFVDDMRRHGVLLVDLTAEMFAAEHAGSAQFLAGDSHWSPAAIDLAARTIARTLTSEAGVVRGAVERYRVRPAAVTHRNDLVALLDLPRSRAEQLNLHESLPYEQVVTPSGVAWQRDPGSEILLIGDSFTEMLSSENGEHSAGGLAEHLSYHLQRDIDYGTSHGVFDAREVLGVTRADARREAAGKKIVVWEFAVRKLAVAQWPLLP